VLLGSAATAPALTEHVGDLRLLHLACHGHFSAATPEASGLRLADRWLTVREIAGLRLRGSLVTLSGCETGRAVVGGGDELLGLVRSFLTAGAAGVVVSLWTVHDESTAELMTAFYNRLALGRTGSRAAVALCDAQRELLRLRPHPTFWAPFLTIGDL
jgi:CHAT domain-containing protein